MGDIKSVNRPKTTAKRIYNKISGWYDWIAYPFEKRYIQVGLRRLSPGKGEMILEIGCGTGHGILQLARAVGESGKVYGIDISERMLEVSKNRIEKPNLSKRVELICEDACEVHLAHDTFDAIFMSFTIELFEMQEIQKILHKCRRILKGNGRIVVVSLSRRKVNSAVRIYEWLHSKVPDIVDCRPIYVVETITQCGFTIVEVKKMILFGLPVDIVLAHTDQRKEHTH
jgi:demethylmenaquinone methyltransferase/2-methoxy-6-polyprenyl-1,4-benzoquinol methylase